MPEYRSFSQWADMITCPYSYQLKRIDKKPQIQAAWTAQGTAVHSLLESWEKAGRPFDEKEVEWVAGSFSDVYWELIHASQDLEPNLDRWFASGPYHAEEDIPRRETLGREGFLKAVEWYRKHPEQTPWVHPDGRLGVELHFEIDLGGVTVIGYVDWYGRLSKSCELGPRDYKSGRNPGKLMQLKLDDIAMDRHFEWRGEERPGGGEGDFFMTRTGKPTVPQNLVQLTEDEVVIEFQQIDQEIRAGDFPANPSEDNCKFCSVKRSCKYRVA